MVPIHWDAAEMQGGHCGHMNIHGVPEITHKSPKIPLPGDLNSCIEGHCKECNEQIRESKWNQEIVVDMSKPSVEDDTDNNKNVVDDSK